MLLSDVVALAWRVAGGLCCPGCSMHIPAWTRLERVLQVEFSLSENVYNSDASAHGISLVLQPEQAAEYGRVSMLKKNFGFIRCCERVTDMFFHINSVKTDSKPVQLGVDVRFVPVLDAETNKVHASMLEVVEPGTAVFEVVGDQVYHGMVKVVPRLPIGQMPGTKGVVVATINGQIETLPFSHDQVNGAQPHVHAKVRMATARVLDCMCCQLHLSWRTSTHADAVPRLCCSCRCTACG